MPLYELPRPVRADWPQGALLKIGWLLKLHSADWWDDPSGFYPAYFSAQKIAAELPSLAREQLSSDGIWPPPTEGLTLLRSGAVVLGDAGSDDGK